MISYVIVDEMYFSEAMSDSPRHLPNGQKLIRVTADNVQFFPDHLKYAESDLCCIDLDRPERLQEYKPNEYSVDRHGNVAVRVVVSEEATIPTDIYLSGLEVNSRAAIGTVVGTLTAEDRGTGDQVYEIIGGDSADDFSIDGDRLKMATIPQVRDSLSVEIRVTNQDNQSYEKQFTISVIATNLPTDISLDNSSVIEQLPSGTVVGNLASVGGFAPLVYSIANTTDFYIDGTQLKTSRSFNVSETSLSATITLTDDDGSSVVESFPISVLVAGYNDATSLSFNGVDELLVSQHIAAHDTSDFSISFWIRVATRNNATILERKNSYGYIVHGDNYGLQVYRPAGNTLWQIKNASDLPVIEEWTHLTYTFEHSTPEIKIYKNGVAIETSKVWTGDGVTDALPTVDTPINIGGRSNLSLMFDGLLDDFAIWDRTLTAGEVVELYNNGEVVDPRDYSFWSDAVGYLEMNNGTATNEVIDIVNGNNAFMTNGDLTNFSTDVPNE